MDTQGCSEDQIHVHKTFPQSGQYQFPVTGLLLQCLEPFPGQIPERKRRCFYRIRGEAAAQNHAVGTQYRSQKSGIPESNGIFRGECEESQCHHSPETDPETGSAFRKSTAPGQGFLFQFLCQIDLQGRTEDGIAGSHEQHGPEERQNPGTGEPFDRGKSVECKGPGKHEQHFKEPGKDHDIPFGKAHRQVMYRDRTEKHGKGENTESKQNIGTHPWENRQDVMDRHCGKSAEKGRGERT